MSDITSSGYSVESTTLPSLTVCWPLWYIQVVWDYYRDWRVFDAGLTRSMSCKEFTVL